MLFFLRYLHLRKQLALLRQRKAAARHEALLDVKDESSLTPKTAGIHAAKTEEAAMAGVAAAKQCVKEDNSVLPDTITTKHVNRTPVKAQQVQAQALAIALAVQSMSPPPPHKGGESHACSYSCPAGT